MVNETRSNTSCLWIHPGEQAWTEIHDVFTRHEPCSHQRIYTPPFHLQEFLQHGRWSEKTKWASTDDWTTKTCLIWRLQRGNPWHECWKWNHFAVNWKCNLLPPTQHRRVKIIFIFFVTKICTIKSFIKVLVIMSQTKPSKVFSKVKISEIFLKCENCFATFANIRNIGDRVYCMSIDPTWSWPYSKMIQT